MISELFFWCMHFLEWLAQVLGTTYECVNVWLFCFIGPAVFLGVFSLMLYYRWAYRRERELLQAARALLFDDVEPPDVHR